MRWWRRLAYRYHLACARDDVARHGLRVPTGVWLCEHCRAVILDRLGYFQHLLAHQPI